MDKYNTLIQRTINNLRQIAKLTASQKIAVDHKSGYLQVDTSPVQFITRMYSAQDRQSAVVAVEENITMCMLLIDLLADINDVYKKVPAENIHDSLVVHARERINLHNKLQMALTGAKDGVSSLINTYIADPTVSSMFDTILKKIEEFIHTHPIIT